MLTYQDLLACGKGERRRMGFIRSAVKQHKASDLYKTAVDAQLYYEGENPTITKYEKVIYDLQGRAHVDMYTANHKIKSSFFARNVDQQTGYLLGNGVTFNDSTTKDKLGTQDIPFDQQASYVAEYALIGGVGFGFWNLDHVDVFDITEFVPLYDEENGALMAGIRFWQVADDKPFRATLYELDGYTDYIQRRGEGMAQLASKRKYREFVKKSVVDGARIYDGENYPGFPIVPLQNNKQCRSALCGKRNTLDAYDLVNSNMVNNVDEGNLIYWVLSNCDGMSDMDDVKFLDRLRTLHVVHTDDDETSITPHAIEAPVDGTIASSDTLKAQLYEDFQMFNAAAVSAGNQTATAIWATYEPLDLKTNKFERQVTKFINGILKLAGIEDKPSYTRDKIINKSEETQVVLMGSEYVTQEYITKKLLTIWGDADMVEDILEQQAAEDLGKFDSSGGNDPDAENSGETPTTDEAINAAEEAVGKTLNASQTSSLITVIKGLKSGDITEGQAVRILTTSIGVTREEALAIIRGEE